MSKLKDRKKAKRVAVKEMVKAGLKRAGKKLLSGALGVGAALLNTQKAYAPNNMGKYVKQKDGSVKFVKTKFMDDDGKGGPLPTRKKAKMSMRKPKMQKRKKQKKVSVLKSQGLSTISVPGPDPVIRVGNKIGNVKVVRQSKNKDLFQGSKGRKKIRETRRKRKRTFNPYD